MNRINAARAVELLSAGEMIILTDDHDRENEGDILVLADRVTRKQIDFMTRFARGLICVPVTGETADRLMLQPMVSRNSSSHGTAFTASVDAANGSTGISVDDRFETIRRLAEPHTAPEALVRPGHIFPLIAKNGGLTERDGHTEAAVELARLCGAAPAGVICEILSGSGSGMAAGAELEEFASEHGLGILSIADLKEFLLHPSAESRLSTEYGDFTVRTYPGSGNSEPAVVLVAEAECKDEWFPVRIHSECLTGDIFSSTRCDCGGQLRTALEYIGGNGGMIVYLRQEGRGIGLTEKIRAYRLQEEGADTWDANIMLGHSPDSRNYREAVSIIRKSGLKRIGLMTNNPDKIKAFDDSGIIVRRIPLEIEACAGNSAYLRTKKEKFNHMFLEGAL